MKPALPAMGLALAILIGALVTPAYALAAPEPQPEPQQEPQADPPPPPKLPPCNSKKKSNCEVSPGHSKDPTTRAQ